MLNYVISKKTAFILLSISVTMMGSEDCIRELKNIMSFNFQSECAWENLSTHNSSQCASCMRKYNGEIEEEYKSDSFNGSLKVKRKPDFEPAFVVSCLLLDVLRDLKSQNYTIYNPKAPEEKEHASLFYKNRAIDYLSDMVTKIEKRPSNTTATNELLPLEIYACTMNLFTDDYDDKDTCYAYKIDSYNNIPIVFNGKTVIPKSKFSMNLQFINKDISTKKNTSKMLARLLVVLNFLNCPNQSSKVLYDSSRKNHILQQLIDNIKLL